jgi:hypothetical protein
MPRNPAYVLTPKDVANVSAHRAILSARMGQQATLDFLTRNGEPRTYRGTISALVGTRKGNESTEAVILELPDGQQKSANLWLIKAIG